MFNFIRRVESKIDQIDAKLDAIIAFLVHQGEIMSQELDALIVQVAANTDLEQSAVVMIQGIAAQLGAAGTDATQLAALKLHLEQSASSLAAAIKANTPAGPAIPAAPSATP